MKSIQPQPKFKIGNLVNDPRNNLYGGKIVDITWIEEDWDGFSNYYSYGIVFTLEEKHSSARNRKTRRNVPEFLILCKDSGIKIRDLKKAIANS